MDIPQAQLIAQFETYISEREKEFERRLNSNVRGCVNNALMNNTEGDYLEFGVRFGDSFRDALDEYTTRRNALLYSTKQYGLQGDVVAWRFFAFDAFEDGLPDYESDAKGERLAPLQWQPGSMASSKNTFLTSVSSFPNKQDVHAIPGFFSETLTPDLYDSHDIRKAAVVHIDCDLEESTHEVLEFCTPLIQLGTFIIFDDFYRYKGSDQHGQYHAFESWKQANPQFRFRDFDLKTNSGRCSKSFVVSGL